MREAAHLAEERIRDAVQYAYGLSIHTLSHLPIGNDAASFVYRLIASNQAVYFLKIRTQAGFSAPSVAVPHFLAEHGVGHIISPIPTQTQALWVVLDGFVLSLYPFVETRTATDAGLTPKLWHDLGATMHHIHTQTLPLSLQAVLPIEQFVPSRRQILTRLVAIFDAADFADPAQRELHAFWQSHHDEIHHLIERSDTLGTALRQAKLPGVLCHADLHTWNILLDTAQHMWIVDWDELVVAPKERDLMFVMLGIAPGLVTPQETAQFLHGYGDPAINQKALTYYRYAWVMSEMGAYAEDVFFASGLSDALRQRSVQAFIGLFDPDCIAAIAYASDKTLKSRLAGL